MHHWVSWFWIQKNVFIYVCMYIYMSFGKNLVSVRKALVTKMREIKNDIQSYTGHPRTSFDNKKSLILHSFPCRLILICKLRIQCICLPSLVLSHSLKLRSFTIFRLFLISFTETNFLFGFLCLAFILAGHICKWKLWTILHSINTIDVIK